MRSNLATIVRFRDYSDYFPCIVSVLRRSTQSNHWPHKIMEIRGRGEGGVGVPQLSRLRDYSDYFTYIVSVLRRSTQSNYWRHKIMEIRVGG